MNREQLAHVLRAVAQIVDDPEVIVIGSQAILGTYSEHQLPAEAVFSMEADLVIAKLVAGREKDYVFVRALLSAELVDVDTLHARAALLPRPGGVIKRVDAAIDRCARESHSAHGSGP